MLQAYMWLFVSIFALSFLLVEIDSAIHPFGGGFDRLYDRHINVFSPDGELLQNKYAAQAASKGDTVVCVISQHPPGVDLEDTKDVKIVNGGEILIGIASKPRDALLDRRGVDKVSKVDDNIWAICTGLAGDGRAMVRLMRKVCTSYRSKFGAAPTLQYLATVVSEMQHDFTLSGNERPYGVSILLVGYDEGSLSPCIFHSSVDGTVTQWLAASAGRGADKCFELMCDRLTGDTDVDATRPSATEAVNLAAEALHLQGVWQADKGSGEEVAKGRPIDLYTIRRLSVDAPATIISEESFTSVAEHE